jgi:putative Ca2+/H+ antiporter (TMEM165/GDT1 family)
MLAFSSVFFSEWADGGQLTAAALSARYQVPFLIWGAGTLAIRGPKIEWTLSDFGRRF